MIRYAQERTLGRKVEHPASANLTILVTAERNLKGYCVKMVEEINVFDRDMFGDVDACRSKVDNATDIRFNKMISGPLRTVRGCRDNADFKIQFRSLLFEVCGTDDLHTFELKTNLVRIAVKSRTDLETTPSEVVMAQQRAPHVTNADKCTFPDAIYAQRLFDGGDQLLHIVTYTTDTKFTEIGEILSDL